MLIWHPLVAYAWHLTANCCQQLLQNLRKKSNEINKMIYGHIQKKRKSFTLLSFQYIRDKLTIILLSTTKNNKVHNIFAGVMSNSKKH